MGLIRVKTARMFAVIMLAAGGAGLAGCVTGIDQAILESAEYSEGFSDGCETADNQSNGFQSTVVENRAISGTNERYIIGWRQGFYACGGRSTNSRRYDDGEWYHDLGG